MQKTTQKLSSNEKGTHSELLAQTALLANGWSVMLPLGAEAYDLSFRRHDSKRTFYAQVKTAFTRNEERYGSEYVVVRGAKNNGDVYRRSEVDYFLAIYDGEVYMFPNTEISEYWVRADKVDKKWTKLGRNIN